MLFPVISREDLPVVSERAGQSDQRPSVPGGSCRRRRFFVPHSLEGFIRAIHSTNGNKTKQNETKKNKRISDERLYTALFRAGFTSMAYVEPSLVLELMSRRGRLEDPLALVPCRRRSGRRKPSLS